AVVDGADGVVDVGLGDAGDGFVAGDGGPFGGGDDEGEGEEEGAEAVPEAEVEVGAAEELVGLETDAEEVGVDGPVDVVGVLDAALEEDAAGEGEVGVLGAEVAAAAAGEEEAEHAPGAAEAGAAAAQDEAVVATQVGDEDDVE